MVSIIINITTAITLLVPLLLLGLLSSPWSSHTIVFNNTVTAIIVSVVSNNYRELWKKIFRTRFLVYKM